MKKSAFCRVFALLTGVAFLHQTPLSALPVFPGAVGFGTDTPAGRGGVVRRVTNLNDSGAGSLRDAIENNSYGFPRVVIFDVSGIIVLQSDLIIRDGRGRLTIAGQTAPSPGIMISGGGFSIRADDLLIQHIAVRPGVANPSGSALSNRDAIKLEAVTGVNINNVVIDHVSASWGCDEIFSTWGTGGTITNVTISNCLIAEGLRFSGRTDSQAHLPPSGDGHSAGVLFGPGSSRITYYRNISTFNKFRNPYGNYDSTDLQIVNNFTYAPGERSGDRINFGLEAGPKVATIRGNYTMLNTGSLSAGITEHLYVSNASYSAQIYMDDSYTSNNLSTPTLWPTNGDPWHSSVTSLPGRTVASVKLNAEPSQISTAGLPIISALSLEADLKPKVGARPRDRDPVDTQVIADINARSNKDWIDLPTDSTGYPAWSMVVRSPGIQLPQDPNTVDAEGYTRLERWLQGLAADLEVGTVSSTPSAAISVSDSFTDGNDNGWSWGGESDWNVVSGAYRQSNAVGGARAYLKSTHWSNQVVEAKVTPLSFAESNRFVAVYSRYQDINNAYYVALRNNGSGTVELKKIVNGTTTTLATQSFPITINTPYKVRLSVSGTSLSAKVTNLSDNTAITFSPVTDTSLSIGRAAIGTYRSTADFDNVFASPNSANVPQLAVDFDDSSASGWTTEASPTTAQDWAAITDAQGAKVYRQNDFTGGARSSVGSATLANQSVQVDAMPLAFDGSDRFFAVYGRYTDINNGYYFALRSNGTAALKRIKAGVITDYTPSPAPAASVNLNAWHVMKIEVTGTNPTTVKGYLNGQLLITGTDTDSPLLTGKAAIGTYRTKAEFDDVIVTSP